jgi:predicted ABC-type ATPase
VANSSVKDKQLWMLTGGNGAGKSTFYDTSLKSFGIPFVNADMIAKSVYPDAPEQYSYQAAQLAESLRTSLLHKGSSFCYETVFSHPSKIDFIGKAKALGYQIILVFIYLDQAMLNYARIQQRVDTGGHYVPEDKVAQRIKRLNHNVKRAIPLCDWVYILNNSQFSNPFQRIVTIENGLITQHSETIPQWLRTIVFNTRK